MQITIEDIKNAATPIFEGRNVHKAVLFGSYAKGVADENSDIDMLVDSGLKGLAFAGLIEELRDILGKQIDLIDVSQLEKNSRIDEEICSTGILIYEN